MTQLSLLERIGISSLQRGEPAPQDSLDSIEVLNPSEQAALLRIQRGAVARAALAGVLSALASVAAGWLAPPSESEPVRYWLVVGSVTAVAALLELGYLYVDALRAVRDMASAAGLRFAVEPAATDSSTDGASDGSTEENVALALARAALELPTPPRSVLGVDPYQDANRAYLVAAGLLYKLKVTVTNFVLKALLRRVLGRFAARAWLELVALPVTAAWNGVVTFWVVREARLRIVGTSAAAELTAWIGAGEDPEPCLRALACVIVQAREVHPNIEALARRLLRGGARELPADLGDKQALLARLRGAPSQVQAQALRAAVAACVIDGRLTRRERALLSELYGALGREVPWSQVRALRWHLTHGDGLRRDLLDAAG
ncbi:MAG TPA: hypothetical protein VLC09_07575 [Polyangiaceae bacterium]|nr:hypothetical protein [Polyangiaceae bacterium]